MTCFSTRSTRGKSCNPWEKCIYSWLQAGSTVCIALACHKWSNIECFLLFTCVMDFSHILSCARQTCLVWDDSVTTMVYWEDFGFHTNLLLAGKSVSAPCSYFCFQKSWQSANEMQYYLCCIDSLAISKNVTVHCLIPMLEIQFCWNV